MTPFQLLLLSSLNCESLIVGRKLLLKFLSLASLQKNKTKMWNWLTDFNAFEDVYAHLRTPVAASILYSLSTQTYSFECWGKIDENKRVEIFFPRFAIRRFDLIFKVFIYLISITLLKITMFLRNWKHTLTNEIGNIGQNAEISKFW